MLKSNQAQRLALSVYCATAIAIAASPARAETKATPTPAKPATADFAIEGPTALPQPAAAEIPPLPLAQTSPTNEGGAPPAATPTPATPPASTPAPTTPPTTPPAPAAEQPAPAEPQVLVSEVQIVGVAGNPDEAQLLDAIYGAIRTQAGATSTRTQLQNDVNAIFGTGLFSNVQVLPEDTPLGVQITFVVEPNPVLSKIELDGARVLPDSVIQETFKDDYGKILNLQTLQARIRTLNTWYRENGYVLAQVVDASRISPNGEVTLRVAEGVISELIVRFQNAEGRSTDEEGNPIRGKTRPFIVTREYSFKEGDVFNRPQAEAGLRRIFGLGLFSDVRLNLEPDPRDPTKVVVVTNVQESSTGNFSAGVGFSDASGLFGTIGLQEQNFGGNNQKLGFQLSVGQRQALFDISFSDPWIAGDPFRSSYSVNVFRSAELALQFTNGPIDVNLPNGNSIITQRTGTQILFTRPQADPYTRPEWTLFGGVSFNVVDITDINGNAFAQDEFGNPLTASGGSQDTLFGLIFGAVRDTRDNVATPTRGSLFRFNVDQFLPITANGVFYNRIRAGYSFYVPIRLLRFQEGCRKDNPTAEECPQTLAFNIQAGTALGNLPPYEAFCIGGVNTVRGYEECGLASGRSFVVASAEYRFPIISQFLGGALFADAGTSLGSDSAVIGAPAVIRGKPGGGVGYGFGVRIATPVGPVRLDLGFTPDQGNRIQFAIGEKF
ncbi:BamA/TamA family outer membrane protein [Synechococcus elongatus]|uniref:BamA/TamA family outer membrane protein n=1 Tax=Synechococcus elongatus TaxID=32046 RepID=UPI000F7F26AA|nr:BamA/TamA family outer membrane protein [Synechococcus elongatus]